MDDLKLIRELLEEALEYGKEGAVREALDALDRIEKQEPANEAYRNEAYDTIDRHLRNTLDDSDYAQYSVALETLYTTPPAAPAVPEDFIYTLECAAENMRLAGPLSDSQITARWNLAYKLSAFARETAAPKPEASE